MDSIFMDRLARRLGAAHSRRSVLGTAGKATAAGLGAALVAQPLGASLFGYQLIPAAQAADATVTIDDFSFDPNPLNVDVGTTVTWTNQGPSPHTVTADDATFDSGQLNLDDTFSQTFAAVGTVAYHCDIHPSMVATVVVNAVATSSYTRPNVHSAVANLDSYARGVEAMKARPDNDPRSWIYQANIHRTVDTPVLDLWNTCKHHSDFFWAWHRMQLYWFEQIVREESGDPDFALPYWDYSDPTKQYLPAPFRDTGSPLYEFRRPSVNARDENSPPWPGSMFDYCQGLSEGGFGTWGDPPRNPIIPGSQTVLETQVHDNIHGWVGGPTGAMSSLLRSARDPVFWLHHANMDRLWASWRAINLNGVSHTDPTDTAWTDTVYEFFDAGGVKISPAWEVKGIVDTTAPNLGYVYEELADNAWFETHCASFIPLASGPPEAAPGTPTPGQELIGATVPEGGIEIGSGRGEPVAVILEQPEAGGTPVVPTDRQVVLAVEGVQSTGVGGVSVEVYINLPAGQEPDFRTPNYVGSIGAFGLDAADQQGAHSEHGSTRVFDISRNLAALEQSGEWTGEIEVTFVGKDLEFPAVEGAASPEAVAEAAAGPWFTVESISISTR